MTKQIEITIEGISPYSPSRFHNVPREDKESADDYEKRTWMHRVHTDAKGIPFLPPMMLKKCLEAGSSYLGKMPGAGNATYTKRFRAGILIAEEIPIFRDSKRVTLDGFEGEWLFLDATGKPGGTRVMRCMPRVLNPWTATATVHILDDIITKNVLESCIREAGTFVGLGRFAPRAGGYYGRFKLSKLSGF